MEEWIEISGNLTADSETTIYEHEFLHEFEALADETKLFYQVTKNE